MDSLSYCFKVVPDFRDIVLSMLTPHVPARSCSASICPDPPLRDRVKVLDSSPVGGLVYITLNTPILDVMNLPTHLSPGRYTIDYIWINFRTRAGVLPRIRTARNYEMLRWDGLFSFDNNIYDDGDATMIELIEGCIVNSYSDIIDGRDVNKDYFVMRITFWPPDKNTFRCGGGMYSTEVDIVTGMKVRVYGPIDEITTMIMDLLRGES
ncbi:uncharacterized protein BP5553_01146 [Venustampulla echinocandica]|uniref:Uncharacterized protein n=1 Tax=Venustampulla echinocandica TaxID=2656787 RepID=A0A370U072_9HELO|nr:uncharacterized protein BP5553_01146 [Venustampulla echinocandica]RDL41167.1 hypothetical protein BP5553_01146 [Venustampulla echinocandica]